MVETSCSLLCKAHSFITTMTNHVGESLCESEKTKTAGQKELCAVHSLVYIKFKKQLC